MLAVTNIPEDDIARAEQLLLPEGKTFDAERREFIRRLDTFDLQAVPGSGKTTALMAKLVILDRYLPFSDGSGILVISHTNAAVDEINRTIGQHCQRLFSYPNFVGTIQSFVDQFLAIPCFVNQFRKRPTSIEQSSYDDAANRFLKAFLTGFTKQQNTMAKYYLTVNKSATTLRFVFDDGNVRLATDIDGKTLTIVKPRANTLPRNYVDWSGPEKQAVGGWIKAFKERILRDGILCFDDAYFLASCYVARMPQIKALVQKRFPYVFVDEMQDMGKHQYSLLEDLFFDGGTSPCAYQRIGDRNQAIHKDAGFDGEGTWQDRQTVLSLSKSYRLSAPTAKVVEYFALDRHSGFTIEGLGTADIKPHLIIYDDQSRGEIVKGFSSILRDLNRDGKVPIGKDSVFKTVAWNAEWNDGEEERDPSKLRLVDFCPTFKKALQEPPVNHDCLDDYLRHFNRKTQTLGNAQKCILNAILKVFRLEEARNPDTGKHFTPTSFLKRLRENHRDQYEHLKLLLYQWSMTSANGNATRALEEVRETIPVLLGIFGKCVNQSQRFLDEPAKASAADDSSMHCSSNILNFDGFDIELATVHSVKGRTHTATLYLETYFQKDGKGINAKSYESQRLAGQFLMNALLGNEGKRVKQSAKMVYVGFSRPTHLLAFAVHRERFDQYLNGLNTSIWEIVRLNGRGNPAS
jgi:DNA helicase-2/ATP-dependent DNA helicase PcrA